MYKAARRIRYGSAYSRPVYTKVGVLAGCPVAMGLLLLAVGGSGLLLVNAGWSRLLWVVLSCFSQCL